MTSPGSPWLRLRRLAPTTLVATAIVLDLLASGATLLAAPSDGSIGYPLVLGAVSVLGGLLALPAALATYLTLRAAAKRPRFATVLAWCLCGASIPAAFVILVVIGAAHGLAHM